MVAEKTNRQLLAALVSSNKKVEDIMNHYAHNFYLITRATYEDLRMLGLSPNESTRIISAFEIFKRAYSQTNVLKISKSYDAYSLFKDLSFSKVEIFAVIFMDRACNIITYEKIFIGGIGETAVDVRIILKRALECGATSFVSGHNHPSGNLVPSTSDKNLCTQLKSASKFLDLNLTDFIIIGNNEFLSFQDTGIF